ncbi:MAG: hypothetical protein CL623_01035 [Arcobacter sp.]|nr:hypothetical protein [Arcobacter sp.]|tara:strand:+ start:918 stop:1385 length:468 start_codon:yes stop_codon:yes gene_type:complete
MLNKGFKLSLAAVTALVLSMSQDSQAREFADIYTECGLGAMIAPRNEAVAAVTNVTWDLGTTAISSNISSQESCKGGQAKVAAYINNSYENIEKDLASGNGKYLDTLVSLSNNSSESKDVFISNLRADFSSIVASSDYSTLTTYQKSQKLYNIIY